MVHGHRALQLALVVFFLGALVHLLMCTQTNMQKLQLALCGGGGVVLWLYFYVVVVVRGSGFTWRGWSLVLLYDYIRAWWLWSIMNEDAT